MRLLPTLTLWFASLAWTAGAGNVVVAVDQEFAPVAEVLVQIFADQTGHDLELSVEAPAVLDRTEADVLLAHNAELPARLAEEGRAAPESLMTYAMGQTGTEAAIATRDAVILQEAAENPVAVAFLDFLLSSEAWDVIVSHGFGAH